MSDDNHLAPPSSPQRQAFAPIDGRPASAQRSQQSPESRPASRNEPVTPAPTELTNTPSIRIRRLSNATPYNGPQQQQQASPGQPTPSGSVRRNRSTSEPQRPQLSVLAERAAPALRTRNSFMPGVQEEVLSPTTGAMHESTPARPATAELEGTPVQDSTRSARLRRARTNIANRLSSREDGDEYEAGLVDILDTVDPEVGTLTTLTNVQNSLFVPDIPYLGNLINRRPTYVLTQRSTDEEDDERPATTIIGPEKEEPLPEARRTYTSGTLNTISSNMNDRYYAVLPHGVQLPGWTEEEKLELNDHVRHMLHSKRSAFKRGMRGFRQYVKKPLGFFVTVYATLITLFGLAWVLFLIGWISVGNRKDYIVNVIDNVLVALFAIMGDGLAPFRAVDTYHMCFIAHYHHLTWRLRREQSLPKLHNKSDLPTNQPDAIDPAEIPADQKEPEYSVLSPEQVQRLTYHQKKFSNSHSFYKPHETTTHHAFPLRLLVAIVVLLDCHSLLQIALGTCTWAINYHHRPFALTTVILCCSITVNITAGVLITIGDKRTRKKDVVERMFRQELTATAIQKVERKRMREMHHADSVGTETSVLRPGAGRSGVGEETTTMSVPLSEIKSD